MAIVNYIEYELYNNTINQSRNYRTFTQIVFLCRGYSILGMGREPRNILWQWDSLLSNSVKRFEYKVYFQLIGILQYETYKTIPYIAILACKLVCIIFIFLNSFSSHKAGATIVPIKVSEAHSFNLVLSSTNPPNESARQMLLTKNAERIDAPLKS